jgi:hypothetical protein
MRQGQPVCSQRAERKADLFFASIMDTIPSQNYTVLYTTTPPAPASNQPASEASRYEMEKPLVEAEHLDLKRDVDVEPGQSHSNQTIINGPLFEKYQFLSPGKRSTWPLRISIANHLQVFSWGFWLASFCCPSYILP